MTKWQPIRLELTGSPVIGSTSSGQKIMMGGFSGLRFLGKSPTGLYRFVTHTDRGPNTDEQSTVEGQERPFGLPEFQPRIVFLEADLKRLKLFISREVPLSHPDGKPVTGLPPESNSEIAVDFHRQKIGSADERGLDLEGIASAADGTFWMAEEYGPGLVQFSADGVLLSQIGPGKGLPEYFRHRRMNRGFESVAVFGNRIYAGLESPLDNPPSKGEKNSKDSRFARILEIDPARKVVTAQFAYILDEADTGKLNDITMEGPDRMLVLERGTTGRKEWRKIYRIYLSGATNLQRLSSKVGGKTGTLESLLPKDFAMNSLAPVKKELVLDLGEMGVKEEKPEGIDIIDDKFMAVITDNDFGLAGGLDHKNAVATESRESPALYFLPISKPKT